MGQISSASSQRKNFKSFQALIRFQNRQLWFWRASEVSALHTERADDEELCPPKVLVEFHELGYESAAEEPIGHWPESEREFRRIGFATHLALDSAFQMPLADVLPYLPRRALWPLLNESPPTSALRSSDFRIDSKSSSNSRLGHPAANNGSVPNVWFISSR